MHLCVCCGEMMLGSKEVSIVRFILGVLTGAAAWLVSASIGVGIGRSILYHPNGTIAATVVALIIIVSVFFMSVKSTPFRIGMMFATGAGALFFSLLVACGSSLLTGHG